MNKEGQQLELDESLISYCGFYCGACPNFLKDKCKGCKGETAEHAVGYGSCKVKPCCISHGYSTCAECIDYESVKKCKDYNPFSIRLGQFITRTNRRKGIEMIKDKGDDYFVKYMADKKWVTMKCSK